MIKETCVSQEPQNPQNGSMDNIPHSIMFVTRPHHLVIFSKQRGGNLMSVISCTSNQIIPARTHSQRCLADSGWKKDHRIPRQYMICKRGRHHKFMPYDCFWRKMSMSIESLKLDCMLHHTLSLLLFLFRATCIVHLYPCPLNISSNF